ncbi:MAG: D-alanyl-D-alanine carboxypeptidase [Ruminococcaceae bacterium]|nr:D-alanyl-D-alanine carboxypeptidase [Oscillospiraceae bacterium]
MCFGVFYLKRFLCFLLSLVFVFSIPISAAEKAVTVSSECDITDVNVPLSTETVNAAIGQTLDIKAKSIILMEANSKEVLYESNSDEMLPPASITKIMPLLLVMEAIDRGDISLETVVTASEHACSMGGSQIWLEPGEAMTVDELLRATVIASANDACVALGELISGSEEGFVALMNQRAAELGMNNTSFKNCTGLDSDGHLTSARDVAIMSSELIKHSLIKKYSTVWMDSLRDGKSELVNTNKLVRFYNGTTGLKTGTTSSAKYCLSATAMRDGLELVAVVLAGETSNDRFEGAKKLLDFGFANFSITTIDHELDQNEIKINKGVKKNLKIRVKDDLKILLPKNAKNDISKTVEFRENLTAPIKKDDVVGTVNVYNGEELIGNLEIVASEDVKRVNFSVILGWILNGMFKL